METTNNPSRQILATELSEITGNAAVNLTSVETMRRNICAARQERNVPPQLINLAATPMLPQAYQETENSGQFLLYDGSVEVTEE